VLAMLARGAIGYVQGGGCRGDGFEGRKVKGLVKPRARLPAVPQSVNLPQSTGAKLPSFQTYQMKVS
jgi:hypothetical protein